MSEWTIDLVDVTPAGDMAAEQDDPGSPGDAYPYADLVTGTIIDDEQLDRTEWFEDFFE